MELKSSLASSPVGTVLAVGAILLIFYAFAVPLPGVSSYPSSSMPKRIGLGIAGAVFVLVIVLPPVVTYFQESSAIS